MFRAVLPCIGLFLSLAALLSCVPLVNTGTEEPFTLKRAGPACDTIAPYGSLLLCFSYPVLYPDSVRFVVNPSFKEYLLSFSKSLDTVTMHFTVPLRGNTGYTIRLAETVESTDGLLLHPQDDSIVFNTYPREQEPNDARATADVFRGALFGAVSAANDTDWFEVADTAKRSFYLVSIGSRSLFDIRDAAGLFVRPAAYAPAETLSAPAHFTKPLYLVVFADNKSNGGSYELRSVIGRSGGIRR